MSQPAAFKPSDVLSHNYSNDAAHCTAYQTTHSISEQATHWLALKTTNKPANTTADSKAHTTTVCSTFRSANYEADFATFSSTNGFSI